MGEKLKTVLDIKRRLPLERIRGRRFLFSPKKENNASILAAPSAGPNPLEEAKMADINGKVPPHSRAPYQDKLDEYVHMILMNTVFGAIECLAYVPKQLVLKTLCSMLGKIVGQVYTGPDDAVNRFRQECRHAFRDAMVAEAIKALPTPKKPEPASPPAPVTPA